MVNSVDLDETAHIEPSHQNVYCLQWYTFWSTVIKELKKGKRKVQGVPRLQAAAFPRHQEEEETDKTKQAQIKQTYEKH